MSLSMCLMRHCITFIGAMEGALPSVVAGARTPWRHLRRRCVLKPLTGLTDIVLYRASEIWIVSHLSNSGQRECEVPSGK